MHNLNTQSDEEIVQMVCNDQTDAYRELIRRYHQKLIRYAVNLVNDPDKAEDVVQNSFIKAYTNLRSFNTKLHFSSWIFRIVHNEAMNCIARQKPYVSTFEILEVEDSLDIEKDLEHKELIEQLKSCLHELPLLYRSPLMLYYFEEKSYAEISDILRLPIGTIGTRINRAKHAIRNICQKKHLQ